MRRANQADLPAMIDFIRPDVANCLYIYINLRVYGTEYPHMPVWVEETDGQIRMVALCYYDTALRIYCRPEDDHAFARARELVETVGHRLVFTTYSMAQRLGIEEGTRPSNTIVDLSYKRDELGDPLINDDHAVALGLVTYDELKQIYAVTRRINELLESLFDSVGITLVDFKVEFGRTSDGRIILADEISPDTCRLWDKQTGEKLDKDRFRRDLGKVIEAYEEIDRRLKSLGK